jgi:hypothetical protein
VAGEPEFDRGQHGVLASVDAGSAEVDVDEPLSDEATQHLAELRDTDANGGTRKLTSATAGGARDDNAQHRDDRIWGQPDPEEGRRRAAQ